MRGKNQEMLFQVKRNSKERNKKKKNILNLNNSPIIRATSRKTAGVVDNVNIPTTNFSLFGQIKAKKKEKKRKRQKWYNKLAPTIIWLMG